MERQKSVTGKKGKGRAQAAPPGEFIALGKSAAQDKPDLKRSSSPQPMGRKLITPGAKREAPASLGGASSLLAKKPKLGGAQAFASLGRPTMESAEKRGSPGPSFSSSNTQPQLMAFEEAAIDVDPSELVTQALAASKEGDEEKVEGLICGAVKHLRNNRSKPDPIVYLSLLYLAKAQPSFFLSDIVTEAFCSVLKRDVTHNFKSKGNALVSVLACNILMAAFVSEENWPDNFVKVYIDDLLGEKVWVDREDCKPFVDNILTAFPTTQPPRHLMVNIEGAVYPFGGASPIRSVLEEEETSKSSDGGDPEKNSGAVVAASDFPVFPRYPCQQSNIQAYVMEVIKDHSAKRQAMDVSSRSLIRLMAVTAGYGEIRTMAGQRLEMWLQNPKLQKSAQDLLLGVCYNCSLENKGDQDIILQLLKMRIKIKQNVSQYLMCIREMLRQHSDNIELVVKTTLINELSNARNPNNMQLLNICFNHASQIASRVLAEVFQDLLASKDDYLRALRGLLRETVRNTRQDIDLVSFCQALTVERQEPKFVDMDATLKERYVMGVVDLIPLSMLLSITPAVKDAATRTDPKEREALYKFRNQLALIERDAVYWLHSVVPKILDVNGKPKEYIHCLRKVLFMELPEFYYNKDNWPPENERNFMLRLVVEAPVLEDTLLRVILIGLTRELPAQSHDCIDIVDNKVRRAAGLHLDNMEVLQISSLELFNALMNLSTYHHPENIVLPKGYTPPQLAITSTYWKSWIVLLMLVAFNPTTFGKEAWEKYPTLKCLMEVMMTNNYSFPPPTYATEEQSVEDARSAERQVIQQEIPKILEFESHLAGITITQQTSLLLIQLMSLDPHGIPRTPPQTMVESFTQLNTTYKIGHMLCRSRQPDFLLDIIERQGTSKSMSWLAELVEASEGSLNVLPVQCLCEFLLHDPRQLPVIDHGDDESNKAEKHRLKLRIRKHQQLLSELQELVNSSPEDTTTMFDVLNYFLQRLASSQTGTRQQAIKGLTMVIKPPGGPSEEEPMEVEGEVSLPVKKSHEWLLKHMPSLPMFPLVKAQLCQALRQACQVESDPLLVNSYIIFLSKHAMDQSLNVLDDLALDVSQLIVERNSVMSHILPDIPSEQSPEYEGSLEAFQQLFYTYISKARRLEKGEYSWSNTQDQIILQWKTGETATMHILVVHAMVIILSYGLPKSPDAQGMYRSLLEVWFPQNDSLPKAFLLDTSEEALLLPDWLKLRMIRSSEQRLVEAALSELDPRQMLLFVQSFGIPVSSMSHLLVCLDTATENDPVSLMQVVQAMNDPSYISRLICIQRMRGAKGGEKFFSLVTEGGSMPAAPSEETKMEVEGQAPPAFFVKTPAQSETTSAATLDSDFFKMLSPETKPQEATKLLQQVLKVLGTDEPKAASLLQSIAQRLESGEGSELVQQMMNQPAKACPVFKMLITKHPTLRSTLTPLLQTILDKAESNPTPSSSSSSTSTSTTTTTTTSSFSSSSSASLSTVISQFLKSQSKHKPASRRRQASIDLDSLKTEGKVSFHAFMERVDKMTQSHQLEALVQQFMQESLQQHSSAGQGVHLACSMLQQHSAALKSSFARESLLTDWLELLDPEIISSDLDLQEELVFGAKSMLHSVAGKGTETKRRTPYLLALLTHQSSWSTLQRCMDRILRTDKLSELDPTCVLDFIWACRHNFKIWQGRELKTTRDITEDIFEFSTEQLLAVVDLIILEAAQYQRHTAASKNSKTHPTSVAPGAKGGRGKGEVKEVGDRLELLLACVCERENRVRSIMSHIQHRGPLVNREEEQCYLELVMEMYLHFPYILDCLPQSVSNAWITTDKIHTKLDTVTHRLIGLLGRAGQGKVVETRMKNANMVCRKLAARHPTLLLRQLPLLAAVIGGRIELSLGEMRHRHLLLLFVNVMGLMELLQPLIFHKQHTALQALLQAFFSLFKTYGKEQRELGSLLSKLVMFLHNFVTYDPQYASSTLQQYEPLLSDLSGVYRDMAELKSLLTGLTLPRQNQGHTAVGNDNSGAGETMLIATGPEPGTVIDLQMEASGDTQQLQVMQSLLDRLQPGTSLDDLIVALNDADETSQRRVTILEHCGSELKELMTHVNNYCRSTAFSLILRHIHHCPRKATQFLSSYLNCLQHSDPEVVTSALKNLAEFTALCQDHASLLLQKAFETGVSSTMNTAPYINETLQLLNMESIIASKQAPGNEV